MRLRLLMKDREYCNALIDVIGSADKDIYVETSDDYSLADLADNTLILTDLSPLSVTKESINAYRPRMIFLTNNPNDRFNPDDTCNKVFKYNSLSSILSDVSQVNYQWTGENISAAGTSMIYAVCGDTGDINSSICLSLARQILFRHGGDILILSLNYVNEYASPDEKDRSKYARLMYYMDIGRDYSIEAFTYSDSYGIKYLRLPKGLNPLAYLDSEGLDNTISNFCRKKFGTVIMDIGNNYSSNNLSMIGKADKIVYVDKESGKFGIGDISDESDVLSKIEIISVGRGENIELRIDDYVRKTYGIEENDEDQEEHDKKIQKPNRRAFERNKKNDNRV